MFVTIVLLDPEGISPSLRGEGFSFPEAKEALRKLAKESKAFLPCGWEQDVNSTYSKLSPTCLRVEDQYVGSEMTMATFGVTVEVAL
jgi:hypothetical protein